MAKKSLKITNFVCVCVFFVSFSEEKFQVRKIQEKKKKKTPLGLQMWWKNLDFFWKFQRWVFRKWEYSDQNIPFFNLNFSYFFETWHLKIKLYPLSSFSTSIYGLLWPIHHSLDFWHDASEKLPSSMGWKDC
jgi:hypothetical protein